MIKLNSKIKLNRAVIDNLSDAATRALVQTAEFIHTETVQAQVMPFDDPRVTEKVVYGKRGRYAKNGREYKGKIVRTETRGGNLQNESTFVDTSESKNGKVSLVNNTPYARRLYFHPEFNFDKGENPNAGGEWYKDWAMPPDGTGKNAETVKKAFKRFYKKEAGL